MAVQALFASRVAHMLRGNHFHLFPVQVDCAANAHFLLLVGTC